MKLGFADIQYLNIKFCSLDFSFSIKAARFSIKSAIIKL
jgi:hypothetical protein